MFLYSHWCRLSLGTRNKIAALFNIPKTMSTHVQDNQLVSDGYTVQDVERGLNIDAIQKYIGSEETDMAILFDTLIAKIEAPELPPQPPIDNAFVEPGAEQFPPVKKQEVITVPTPPKKRGRPVTKTKSK